jgi:hypothetical protein
VNDVYALVRSIRQNRLPRNRHFDEHDGDRGARARRLHRFLRGVERDLLAASEVGVRQNAAGIVVRMAFPTVRLTREVSLTADDRALLVENPELARLLAPSENGCR